MATSNRPEIVLSAKDATAAAFASVKANLRGVQAAATGVAGSLSTVGALITGAFTGASLAGAAEVLDTIDKMSERTGIASESLSGLRYIAQIANVPLEALGVGLRKLAVNAADAAGGGKESVQLFSQLGISVRDTNGQLKASDKLLEEVADRFVGMGDGIGKTALAVKLFGRNGEELIPLLNQGSAGLRRQREEAEKLGAVYGGDLTRQAANFKDNLERIQLAAEGAKVVLLGQLLPTLNSTAEAFLKNAQNSGVFIGVLKTIGQGIAQRLGLDDLSQLQNKAEMLAGLIENTTNELRRIEAAAASGDAKMAAAAEDRRKRLADLQRQAQETNAAITAAANILDPRGALAQGEDATETARRFNRPKPQAPVIDNTRQDALKEFNSLVDRIRQRIAIGQRELELGRKLTDGEREEIEVTAHLAGLKTQLTQGQKRFVIGLVQENALVAERLRINLAVEKAQVDELERIDRVVQAIENEGIARAEANASLRQQLEAIGLTARELEALTQQRLAARIEGEKAALAAASAAGATDIELIALRQKIALLEEELRLRKGITSKNNRQEDDPLTGARRAIKTYLDEISRAGVETRRAVGTSIRSLEDELTSAFSGKGFDARRLVDEIIAEFARLAVVRPLLDQIFGSKSGQFNLLGLLGLGSLTGKARGGRVLPGDAVVVGEEGPEVLQMGATGGYITPNAELVAGRWGGPTVTLIDQRTVNVDVASRSEVAKAIAASDARQREAIARSMRHGTGGFA